MADPFHRRMVSRVALGACVQGAGTTYLKKVFPEVGSEGAPVTTIGLPNLVGRVVGGTYRILAPLSEGGMGAVYVAEHVRFGRKFAVKFLGGAFVGNEEAFARFRQEAQIAGQLGHPNIVEVVDFNVTEEGIPYLVMELLEGRNLAEHLQEFGPFSMEEALDILEQVADALEAAHRAGVVHRDLKPQNVFLAQKGDRQVAKVLDFGISKVQSGAGLTRTNTVMGTPNYMSPEQAQGRTKDVDCRTDIFALGCIFYEMVTGRQAFPGDNAPAVLFLVSYKEPEPLQELLPGVPPQVPAVLAKALAKDREARYVSARAFVDDLRRAAAGLPVSFESGAHSTDWPEATRPTNPDAVRSRGSIPRAWLTASVLGGVAVVLLAVFGGYAAYRSVAGRSTRPRPGVGERPRPVRRVPRHSGPAGPVPQDAGRRLAAPRMVAIRILVLPAEAHPTVFVDNRPVPGRVVVLPNGKRALEATVRLPRSQSRVVPVRVSATGFQDVNTLVTPSGDRTVEVALRAIRTREALRRASRFSRRPRRRSRFVEQRTPSSSAQVPSRGEAREPSARPTGPGPATSRPGARPTGRPGARPAVRPRPGRRREGVSDFNDL